MGKLYFKLICIVIFCCLSISCGTKKQSALLTSPLSVSEKVNNCTKELKLSKSTPIVDLSQFNQTAFKDLPDFSPSLYKMSIEQNFLEKIKLTIGRIRTFGLRKGLRPIYGNNLFFLDPGYLLYYRSREAEYNGIIYTLGLPHRSGVEQDEKLPVLVLTTSDEDFCFDGFHVGDSIDDNSLNTLATYKLPTSSIYFVSPKRNWAARVKDNRITEFWRTDYDGLTIDSVMESNRCPQYSPRIQY